MDIFFKISSVKLAPKKTPKHLDLFKPTAPLATPHVLCFFVKPCCICGQSWGGVGMLTFLEPAHILDATQLRYSCAHKHA